MVKKLGPGCSYGKVLKCLNPGGFIITEVKYSAKRVLPEHSHENAHFCFVLQGAYTETCNKEKLECRTSTLTFRPSGETHKNKFNDQEVRVFTIEIPSLWIERLQQDSIYLDRSISFQGGNGADFRFVGARNSSPGHGSRHRDI